MRLWRHLPSNYLKLNYQSTRLMTDNLKTVAVLVDADNVKCSLANEYIKVASRYGRTIIRRVYGDWSKQNLCGWKKAFAESGFVKVQASACVKKKSTTDSTLLIGAMDLLHENKVDVFCIVTSDSDFAGLCHRIRQDGKLVVGIGRDITHSAFVNACDDFIQIEKLEKSNSSTSENQKMLSSNTSICQVFGRPIDMEAIHRAYTKAIKVSDKKGVYSGIFAKTIRREINGFDVVHYGFKSFISFCQSLEGYDVHFVKGTRRETAYIRRVSMKTVPATDDASSDSQDFNIKDMQRAYQSAMDVNGVPYLSLVNAALRRRNPSFDHKSLGFKSFRLFCDSLAPHYHVSFKNNKSTAILVPGQKT